MVTVTVSDYAQWQRLARMLRARNVSPEQINWQPPAPDQGLLPFPGQAIGELTEDRSSAIESRVPRAFVELAQVAACHRRRTRWHILYRVLWRLAREGRALLELATDEDVQALHDMSAQVRRDEHKMHAFVRFAPVAEADGVRYVAWYRPDHLIVRRAAPFFAERFSSMRWSILTPDLSAHWNLEELSFSEGVAQPMARAAGQIEELWRTYYAAVFDPNRVNLRATLREMPLRRWSALPEAALIPGLVSSAHARTSRAGERQHSPSARPFVPPTDSLENLRQAAASCRGCPLHEPATQVVFGEGPPTAALVLVGEQPGDVEDRQGRPFVGPAGRVLDAALAAAAIDRQSVYLTNAVKHFSFEPRGKRRIHQTPRLSEMQACRPWLEAELHAIRPTTVVCLGSVAARALLGPQARVMALRGRVLRGLSWASGVVVTVHPAAALRSGDDQARYFDLLVADLSLAASELQSPRRER